MTITATYAIAEPKQVRCKLELTMTVDEWERLLAKLGDDYPAWRLGSIIRLMPARAHERFGETVSEP